MKRKENGKEKKNSKKLVSLVITAMIVMSLMPAFVPLTAAATLDRFEIDPDEGIAGKTVGYNVTINATTAWNTLNITIPAGFEAVTPSKGKEIVTVDFYNGSAWYGNITLEGGDPSSSKIDVVGYNQTKDRCPTTGTLTCTNVDYSLGGRILILSPFTDEHPELINLTLPTDTKNGTLTINLSAASPTGQKITNATINISKFVKNPTTVGNYPFVAGDPQTAWVNITADAPNKWYVNTTINGNTTTAEKIKFGINVTDQYGNLNDIGAFDATITVLEGTATVNPYNPTTGATAGFYPVWLNATATPTKVNVRISGDGLVSTTKWFEFFKPVSGITATVTPTEIYANNTERANVSVQLVDADGNPVSVADWSVTICELNSVAYPEKGLTFYNSTGGQGITIEGKTNSDGIVYFDAKAGTESGTTKLNIVAEKGLFAEKTLTLKQAPNVANTQGTVYPAAILTITAGVGKLITATLKDYNGSEMKSATAFPVKFNITAGGTKWLENNETVYETTSDTTGNVSATLYSTNASAANRINVTISLKNETGGWEDVKDFNDITVDANVATQLEITPAKSMGLKNVNGTHANFTIQLLDAYGNKNTSNGPYPVLVTTDNEALGNLTCQAPAGTTVNNNLWCNITGDGNTTFKYTVNTTDEGTAHLTVNVSGLSYITEIITIQTSGPTGLNLMMDPTLPLVGTAVQVTAQLTSDVGDIAVPDIRITFMYYNPSGGLIDVHAQNTDAAGQVVFGAPPQNIRGIYTMTARNDTPGLSAINTTTYVGNASQIWIAVNKTNPDVNETITVYAIFKDDVGYNSSSVMPDNVDFLADGSLFATTAINNKGVASATYTRATAGTVTIVVWYTNAANPFWEGTVPSNSTTVTFGPPPIEISVNITSPPDPSNTSCTWVNVTYEGTGDIAGYNVSTDNTTWTANDLNLSYKFTGLTNTVATPLYVRATGTGEQHAYDHITVTSYLGDIDNDGKVGLYDLIAFAAAYDSKPGDTNWNPKADFDGDDKVGLYDLIAFAGVYDTTYW